MSNETEYIDPKQIGEIRGVRLQYKEIDTRLAEKYTNQQLLRFAESCVMLNGWGIICEILKRFEKMINE